MREKKEKKEKNTKCYLYILLFNFTQTNKILGLHIEYKVIIPRIYFYDYTNASPTSSNTHFFVFIYFFL